MSHYPISSITHLIDWVRNTCQCGVQGEHGEERWRMRLRGAKTWSTPTSPDPWSTHMTAALFFPSSICCVYKPLKTYFEIWKDTIRPNERRRGCFKEGAHLLTLKFSREWTLLWNMSEWIWVLLGFFLPKVCLELRVLAQPSFHVLSLFARKL